jgi:hypothetical protein
MRSNPGRYSESGRNFVNPTDLWQPVSMPILGLYNDYGFIEDYSPASWQVTSFLQWIRPRLVEQEQGENAVLETPIRRADVTSLEYLCDNIHRQAQRTLVIDAIGRSIAAIYKKAPYHGDPLGFALIREDVYQGLAQTQIQGWRGAVGKDSTLAKLTTWLHNKAQQGRTCTFNDDRGLWGPDFSVLAELSTDLSVRLMEPDVDRDALIAETSPKLEEISTFLMVHAHLDLLRKSWSPQCGAGSQDDGIDTYAAFIDILQRALDNMRRHRFDR